MTTRAPAVLTMYFIPLLKATWDRYYGFGGRMLDAHILGLLPRIIISQVRAGESSCWHQYFAQWRQLRVTLGSIWDLSSQDIPINISHPRSRAHQLHRWRLLNKGLPKSDFLKLNIGQLSIIWGQVVSLVIKRGGLPTNFPPPSEPAIPEGGRPDAPFGNW